MRNIDPVPSTEGVEPFLRISTEFQFIVHVDFEPFLAVNADVFNKIIDGIMLL
jgi:hypothetical protein